MDSFNRVDYLHKSDLYVSYAKRFLQPKGIFKRFANGLLKTQIEFLQISSMCCLQLYWARIGVSE